MPHRSLGPALGRQLNEIRKELDLSQQELATEIGVSQGTVSNSLKGEGVEQETLLRLVHALEQRVRWRGGDAAGEGGAWTRTVEHARKLASEGVTVHRPFARPGGAMDHRASNFVPRTAWSAIENGLHDHPVTMAIDGPPMVGKSSLAQQLLDEAASRGFQTSYFSCKLVARGGGGGEPTAGEGSDAGRMPSHPIWIELADSLKEDLELQLPDPNAIQRPNRLFRWFLSERRKRADVPALIVLDDIASLHDQHVVGELHTVVRTLHGFRTSLNLSWCLVRAQDARLEKVLSESVLAFDPLVQVGFFDSDEQLELLARWQIRDDCRRVAEKLVQRYKGQPFLCGLALHRLHTATDSGADLRDETGPDGAFTRVVEAIEHPKSGALASYLRAVAGSLPEEATDQATWSAEQLARITGFEASNLPEFVPRERKDYRRSGRAN